MNENNEMQTQNMMQTCNNYVKQQISFMYLIPFYKPVSNDPI